ncbi:hypothetical protein FACS1894181_09750 [Bacteroidia bacterium]|nr:hypothetical protein FACS1894181_09750 [Bacteroidia bacterium]
MEIIKKTLHLSRQMTIAQVAAYYSEQKERLAPLVVQVPLLAKSWQAFDAAQALLEAAYKRAAASPLTPVLVIEETGRDNEFMFINNTVNNVLRYSSIAEEVAAARVLEPELANHAGLPHLEYEAETASSDDLIDKFEEAPMTAALARLGLAPHFVAFKQFHGNFKSGYRERLDERHARRVMGTAVEHGRQTAVAFDAFCNDVTSLNRMLTDAALLAILAQIAASINAVTEQFTIIVHRHLGLNASKDDNNNNNNNNNGDGDGDGFTDPDIKNPNITDPENPENPDIDNPPPPPFLPDFE